MEGTEEAVRTKFRAPEAVIPDVFAPGVFEE